MLRFAIYYNNSQTMFGYCYTIAKQCLAIVIVCCLSVVCLSVMRVYCDKTVKDGIMWFALKCTPSASIHCCQV